MELRVVSGIFLNLSIVFFEEGSLTAPSLLIHLEICSVPSANISGIPCLCGNQFTSWAFPQP